MKRIHLILLCCLMLAACAQQIDYSPYQDKLNIYLVNDMVRNGYYDQKPLAELMGQMAGEVDPECVAALGDVPISMEWRRCPTGFGSPIMSTSTAIPT